MADRSADTSREIAYGKNDFKKRARMKNGFKPFDDVADSMTAAASRLGVPLSAVKMAKRNGSEAFRGSRVHLGKLREELASAEKESPGTSDVLFVIAQEVAQRVFYSLARCRGKRFVADSDKICQAIHNGFAVLFVSSSQIQSMTS